MPRARFENKKDYAFEDELASELASELSYDERGGGNVVESQVVEFINEYANDEYEGKF